jgi:hypothetical protein
MRYSVSVLTVALTLSAQPPAALKEAQAHDLPPRTAPTDYQAQAQVGPVTIAADFTGHGMPCPEGLLMSEEFVAVEVGLYGPPDTRFNISTSEFSLRINGKKNSLPSQPYGLAGKEVKDPEWTPPESGEKKSKGSIGGSGQGDRGAPPPSPPKVPIELRRNWQQRIQRAAISEGDRPLPQAGLLFFQYRGKADKINTVELIYEGPAGTATLNLR